MCVVELTRRLANYLVDGGCGGQRSRLSRSRYWRFASCVRRLDFPDGDGGWDLGNIDEDDRSRCVGTSMRQYFTGPPDVGERPTCSVALLSSRQRSSHFLMTMVESFVVSKKSEIRPRWTVSDRVGLRDKEVL